MLPKCRITPIEDVRGVRSMWIQHLIGHCIQTRLWGKDLNSASHMPADLNHSCFQGLQVKWSQSLSCQMCPARFNPDQTGLSQVGGSESGFRQQPRNLEIVSFRARMRRAMSGCEEESRCKIDVRRLSLFFFRAGNFPFSFDSCLVQVSPSESKRAQVNPRKPRESK